MGLGGWIADKKDGLVQSLALGWIKGKVDALRKAGSPVMKVLDGNKRLVVVIVYLIASIVAVAHGGADYTKIANGFLLAMGYTPDAGLAAGMVVAGTQAFAVWTFIDTVIKSVRQWKAGATLSEINSTTGIVKAALAAGQIVDSRTGTPMADTTAPAKAVPLQVATKAPVVVVEASR